MWETLLRKWLAGITSNPKFYSHPTSTVLGIIQLNLSDRKEGSRTCRIIKEMEEIVEMYSLGYLNFFSPTANFLIKHRRSRNAFLILFKVKSIKKKKSKFWNCDYLQTSVSGIAWSVKFCFLKDAQWKKKSECNF